MQFAAERYAAQGETFIQGASTGPIAAQFSHAGIFCTVGIVKVWSMRVHAEATTNYTLGRYTVALSNPQGSRNRYIGHANVGTGRLELENNAAGQEVQVIAEYRFSVNVSAELVPVGMPFILSANTGILYRPNTQNQVVNVVFQWSEHDA